MQTATLSRADLEAYDPEGGRMGRWLCPIPGICSEHTDPRRHRSLKLEEHGEKSGLWHCHRCHAQGQIKEAWKDFKPKSKRERDADLMARRRVGLEKILAKVATPDADQKTAPAPKGRFGSLSRLETSRPALAYLTTRGISSPDALALLTASGVRFAPDFGRRGAAETVKASSGTASVVFPLRDAKGKLIAAQGRFLKPWSSGQKFHTLGDKLAGVFATHGAMEIMQKGGPVAIVEAPLDAVTLALAGVPALALCGCNGLPEWLQRKACGRHWLIAFDADEAGDRAGEQIGEALRTLGGHVQRLKPTEAKDWNEALQTGGEVWDRTAEALQTFMVCEAIASHESPRITAKSRETPQEADTENQKTVGHFGTFRGTEPDDQQGETQQNATKCNAPEGRAAEIFPAGDLRGDLLEWVIATARARGGVPVPLEPVALPSGQKAPAGDDALDWFIAGHDRAVRLRRQVSASPRGDARLALLTLRTDLFALAQWFAHAWNWERCATEFQGTVCILPTYFVHPERRNPLLSDPPRYSVAPDMLADLAKYLLVDMTRFQNLEACQ
jgi:hypothetical protein